MNAIAKKLEFPYEIIRTNRKKTASIKVVEGQVQVIVPMDLPQDEVEGVVIKKRQWVRDKIRLFNDAMPAKPKEYVNGECFTYLGRNYKLKIITSRLGDVKLKGGYLEIGVMDGYPVRRRSDFIQKQISSWFKHKAEKRIKAKAKRLAMDLGLEPRSVLIKDYKSRWGSCSVDGDVSFNWKVIIAPNHIVDYVVAHELCHLFEHNHSPAFWKRVERIIPDYKDCKDWLKNNSVKLIV